MSVVALSAGCAYQHPTGFDALMAETPEVLQAKVGGYAGQDGRTAVLNIERSVVSSGMGIYRLNLDFNVGFDRSNGPGFVLECRTDPSGPDVPETRFGCWSLDGHQDVSFWMAPGEECVARNLRVASTLVRPECWRGELSVDGETFEVSYGIVEATDSPIGRLSWVDEQGRPVQAVDSVVEHQLQVHRSVRAKGAVRDVLTLHAVAMHYYWHAMSPD